VTAPTDSQVLVFGPDTDIALIEALGAQGWTPADPHANTPVGLLIITPASQDGDDGTWSAAAAMDATADVILRITESRERLRSGRGLVVVAVAAPPGRAAVRSAGDGVVAAALAMTVQLLAADWAPDGVRCLLVVTGDTGGEPLARLTHWLASPAAPALSGQTIDLAAVDHATLRAPGA
jgi:NAD(P)-dependent dehydrogenase (short-subunit alcohol dehydrogenase family)